MSKKLLKNSKICGVEILKNNPFTFRNYTVNSEKDKNTQKF